MSVGNIYVLVKVTGKIIFKITKLQNDNLYVWGKRCQNNSNSKVDDNIYLFVGSYQNVRE